MDEKERAKGSRRRLWLTLALTLVGSLLLGFFTYTLVISRRAKDNLPFGGGTSTPKAMAEDKNPRQLDAVAVVGKVGPAVVMINTRTEEVGYDFFSRPYVTTMEGLGSGVIIDKRGYILTNNHVIAGATKIEVTIPGRAPVKGTLVGADPPSDLAVVKVKVKNPPVAKLGDSTRLQVGEPVVAIGNPLGFDNTVTTGVVSALGRTIPIEESGTTIQLEELIQTDASINPGNSGGALITARSEVVGINTAIIQQAQGIGFAIPIHVAREVVDNLVRYGRVLRLGIMGTEITPETAKQIQGETGVRVTVKEGIFVAAVQPDTAADKAGIQPGDIITSAAGKSVRVMRDLTTLVRRAHPGERIDLIVVRKGREMRIRVLLV